MCYSCSYNILQNRKLRCREVKYYPKVEENNMKGKATRLKKEGPTQ